MYKTIIAKYFDGVHGTQDVGNELQNGEVDKLNKLLNDEYENGWELVSMTAIPYRFEPGCCDYALVFKKRSS